MSDQRTHYEVLGVTPTASNKEIKAAYRALSKKLHPDFGGSHDAFAAISQAADVLLDSTKRSAYDFELKSRTSRPGSSSAPRPGQAPRPEAPSSAGKSSAGSTASSPPPPEAPKIIVPCPHCGRKNRVLDLPIIQTARCGACKKPFDVERPEQDSYGKIFNDFMSSLKKNSFGEYINRAEEKLKKVKGVAEDLFRSEDRRNDEDLHSEDPVKRAEARLKDYDDYLKRL